MPSPDSEPSRDPGAAPPASCTGPVYDFSLVVATLDDAGELTGLLDSLCALLPGISFEVIVVDQNPDARLVPVLAAYAGAFPLRHQRVAFQGASRARNEGAALAQGRWLSFPDDDCRYFPDTLLRARTVLLESPARLVTGRTVDEERRATVLRWGKSRREFGPWTMFMCLTEAVLFVERELFERAGGFDERFGPGALFPAAEGIELMNRLFALGRREGCAPQPCFDPAIQLYHPDKVPPWDARAVRRFFEYAQGDGALVAKNPQPHMLYWVCRTLASASLQTLFFRGWASIAFAARIAGLLKGAGRYALSRRAPTSG